MVRFKFDDALASAGRLSHGVPPTAGTRRTAFACASAFAGGSLSADSEGRLLAVVRGCAGVTRNADKRRGGVPRVIMFRGGGRGSGVFGYPPEH